MSYPQAAAIADIIQAANTIVIVQADNPDADSLGSALALEHILGDMGKQPVMYCSVETPSYLRYLEGWDRIVTELPHRFDASIIVDASTTTLLDKLQQSGQQHWLSSKPCVVIDHHQTVEKPIEYAQVLLNDYAGASSTGEVLFNLARQLEWPLGVTAQTNLMTAILGDTQGLSNQLTSAATYRIMADMTDAGVDRASLEEQRRAFAKMPPVIFKYKGTLIDRAELVADGRLAIADVPHTEIREYSPLYNPVALIQPDMLQTRDVLVSIVFKRYDDGKITAAIRCNTGAPVAARIAEHFGGGGHDYASGFKLVNGRPFNEVKSECIEFATQLLDNLTQGTSDETLQHTQQTA